MGPGEVDDELEDEVGSECAKYGIVTRVLIFEITEPNFPVHEAVRIFVQFERSEETTKALVDLDGRYFGGRVVRATFYDEEKVCYWLSKDIVRLVGNLAVQEWQSQHGFLPHPHPLHLPQFSQSS